MAKNLNKIDLNREMQDYFIRRKRSDWSYEKDLDTILKSISNIRKNAWTMFARYIDEKPSLALGLIARATIHQPT